MRGFCSSKGVEVFPRKSSVWSVLLTALLVVTGCSQNPPMRLPGFSDVQHVVQRGESLEQISQRYFARPQMWRVFCKYNSGLCGRPLTPGQVVYVPGHLIRDNRRELARVAPVSSGRPVARVKKASSSKPARRVGSPVKAKPPKTTIASRARKLFPRPAKTNPNPNPVTVTPVKVVDSSFETGRAQPDLKALTKDQSIQPQGMYNSNEDAWVRPAKKEPLNVPPPPKVVVEETRSRPATPHVIGAFEGALLGVAPALK